MKIDRKLVEEIYSCETGLAIQTFEKIKEALRRDDVEQHFADGGEVEVNIIGRNNWGHAGGPCWDWDAYDYRIKQKSTSERRDDLLAGLHVFKGPIKADIIKFLEELKL